MECTLKQYSNYIDRNIGDCYIFKINGKVELYDQEKFLEHWKNAAVEHINNSLQSQEYKLFSFSHIFHSQ